MSVNGVSDSPLLERAVYGDQSRVPIGAPVITNKKQLNSKEIQLLITGNDLTEPLLNQFETFGNEGKEAYRKPEENGLDFRDRQNLNDRLIAEWAYDRDTGDLVLVRTNKEELRLPGFMRQDDFGIGATGPRGLPGRDGKDGFDGRDGKDGAPGCAGPQGPVGSMGSPGREGNPGVIGIDGPEGCEGSTGDRGVMGPQGRPGFEGSRGLTGPSCGDDKQGGEGPQGEEFGLGVMFGLAAMNDRRVAIMGLDDDGIDAVAPPGGWGGATIPPPTSTPAVPTPPPPTGTAKVTVCTNHGDVKQSCGNAVTAWYSTWANYDGPNGTKGISTLPRPNQVLEYIPDSLVMCGTLAPNASYLIELTTPRGVASSLFANCSIVGQTDYPGGTTKIRLTPTKPTSLRVRYLSNASKIPFWVALRILNADTGEVLYRTGQNAYNSGLQPSVNSPNANTYMTDPNWRGNAPLKHYN